MSTSFPTPTPSGPKPGSSDRAEASRLNGAKSHGPKTAEGKVRSSMNAVKHGLTAQTSVLAGEDRRELEALSRGLMAQLRPADPLQRLLAERIVAISWKLRRVAAAEERAAAELDERAVRSWEGKQDMYRQFAFMTRRAGSDRKPSRRDGAALLADSFREVGSIRDKAVDGPLLRITYYELKLDAALRAAVRELRALKKEEQNFATEEEPVKGREQEAAPAEAVETVTPVAAPVETAAAPRGATECHAAPHFPANDANRQNEPEAAPPAPQDRPGPSGSP